MLSRKPFLSLPLLLISTLLLSACCRNVACDCVTSGLNIRYLSNTGSFCVPNLVDQVSVEAYSSIDNSPLGSAKHPDSFDCNVFLEYVADQYWVIRSDTFGISDTVRIANPEIIDSDDGCCDCGLVLVSGDFTVGNQPSNQTQIERFY